MTLHWLIIACMAFVIVAKSVRGRPGDALADIVVLVFLFAAILLVDIIASRFIYTRDIGLTIAAIFAGAFAIDAFCGLLAPARQHRRNQKLRSLMRRVRA